MSHHTDKLTHKWLIRVSICPCGDSGGRVVSHFCVNELDDAHWFVCGFVTLELHELCSETYAYPYVIPNNLPWELNFLILIADLSRHIQEYLWQTRRWSHILQYQQLHLVPNRFVAPDWYRLQTNITFLYYFTLIWWEGHYTEGTCSLTDNEQLVYTIVFVVIFYLDFFFVWKHIPQNRMTELTFLLWENISVN